VRLRTRPLTVIATLAAAAVLTAGIVAASPQGADAATSCAPNSSSSTPSAAVQDACGDHAMGRQSAFALAQQNGIGVTAAQTTPDVGDNVLGFDVSGWQTSTDWAGAVAAGYKFVFIKSTESDNFINPYFNGQWVDAGKAGLLRGTYHFAQPAQSSGAAQAEYFYAHGAAMSAVTPGTLPPVLDIENSNCAGMTQAAMVSWIGSFMSTLKALTGRTPLIYTYQKWWNNCTGANTSLAAKYPLWIADPTPTVATEPRMPGTWKTWTFWQWGAPPFSGGGDADVFHGTDPAVLASAYATYPRIAGTDRWATSTQTAQEFVSAAAAASTATTGTATGTTSSASAKPVQTVFIASGQTPFDALSGGAAAGALKAPIMLVSPTAIPPVVEQQLWSMRPQEIVILGGPNAVSAAVQKKLAGYSISGSTSAVKRISGSDRYATSAAIATQSFAPGVANAYVAVGTSWPDALSGSAAAASPATAGPVLLVNGTTVPSSVAAALTRLRPKKITIFGGTAVVSSGVQAALAHYTAGRTAAAVTRLAGSDRWGTSQQIATRLFGSGVPVAYVVSGTNFPDALTGAPLSALDGGAPVLLTEPGSIPPATAGALAALKPKSIVVIGGSASVSAAVQSALKKYVTP